MLPGHFWKNPDFGLPAASGLRGGRRPGGGLFRPGGGLWMPGGGLWMPGGGRRRPGGGPKLLFEVLVVCLRRFFPGKKRAFLKFWTSDLEKKSAPGRLSRARDPSRSIRAAILRRGMFWGSQTADLEVDWCKIEGPRVPGPASTFFGLQGGGVPLCGCLLYTSPSPRDS